MSVWEIEGLQILVLTTPVLIVAMAIFVVWLTGWMGRRGQPRHPVE